MRGEISRLPVTRVKAGFTNSYMASLESRVECTRYLPSCVLVEIVMVYICGGWSWFEAGFGKSSIDMNH